MNTLRKIWVTYVLFLHILLAIVLLKSNFIEKVERKLELYKSPELSEYYNEITAYHKRIDGAVPRGAAIFIGDSITQSLATSAVSELSVNYGIGSDTTLGVLNRLPIYESINSINSIKAVVIAIGVNDLARRNNDSIIDNYEDILDYIPKNTKILVSAILPIDERVQSKKSSNERISKLTSSLKKLTENYENVVFVDSSNWLKGDDDNLKTEFHSGDGVHLSTAGYEIWISQLRAPLKGT